MGAFLGCCVIAGVLWHVGRKIVRVLYGIGVMLDTIGTRFEHWPTAEDWHSLFGKR